MDPHDIAQQALIEHQILKHITNALRESLDWDFKAADVSRKLSTVRFVFHSLQRHIERQLQFEEVDGYMTVVVEKRPALSGQIDALKQEHAEFRRAIARIVERLESIKAADRNAFQSVCDEIRSLLDRLAEHGHKEADLLQEALLQEDVGLD